MRTDRRTARRVAPRRRILALAAAAFVAACQPSTPSAAPTGGPAPSGATASLAPASQGASAPPSTSSAAARLRLALGDEPFIGPGDGPAGMAWDLPAAGTRDRDGNLVLVIVWCPVTNAQPLVTVSTSADGEGWDIGHEHIFEGLTIGDPDPGPIPSAIVQLDDGSWQMYGWAAADSSGSRFWSWRTSAPALEGPWILDRTEMLEPGPSGSWDSQMAAAGPVLRDADGYRMRYEGGPPGSTNRGDIGLATSADGLAWTKFDDPATTDPRLAASDPVIPTGICGASTDIAVEQPQVELVGDEYVALFGGFAEVNHTMDL